MSQCTSVSEQSLSSEDNAFFGNLSYYILDKVITCIKETHKDSPMAILKTIVAYFNRCANAEVDDLVNNYVDKLPRLIKAYIYKELDCVTVQTLEIFFDHCMVQLAENMAHQCPVIGYKIMIQIIAFKYPAVAEKSLSKMLCLRNTYRDNEGISLKLLWGFGQAGYKNINVGIRIWLNLMAPLIENPLYSNFCASYISRIVDVNSLKLLCLNNREFNMVIEALMKTYCIPEDLVLLLTDTAGQIATKFVEKCQNVSLVFLILLKNMDCRNSLVDPIITSLYVDPGNCFTLWNMVLSDNLTQTQYLLNYINNNWEPLRFCLGQMPKFIEFLDKIRCNPSVAGLANTIWGHLTDKSNSPITLQESLTIRHDEIQTRSLETDEMMEDVVNGLGDQNSDVRLQAVRCVHALSEFVSQLREIFQSQTIWRPLLCLLKPHQSSELLSLVTSTICNLLLEFAPAKELILESGAVEFLGELTRNKNPELRLNGVWAMMNMALQAEPHIKNKIIKTLGIRLFHLLADHDPRVIMKTLGLMRNLLSNAYDIESIMSRYSKKVLEALYFVLESTYSIELKEQALCIIGNVAVEAEQDYVMGNCKLLRKLGQLLLCQDRCLQNGALYIIRLLVNKNDANTDKRRDKLIFADILLNLREAVNHSSSQRSEEIMCLVEILETRQSC